MKKHTVKLVRILGFLILMGLLCSVLLQTPPGKEMLSSALERALSGSENLDVRIGKISGWIPASIRVDRLEIADAEGTWLTAENLKCRWMLRDLLRGRFRFAHLGAETIDLHRFPRGGAPRKTDSRDENTSSGIEVILDKLAVKQLNLGKGVAGIPLAYTVRSGGIQLLPSGRLTGSLNVEGDAEGSVELDALLGGSDGRLRILAELGRMVNPTFGLDHLSGKADIDITRAGVQGRVSAAVHKDELDGLIDVEFEYASRYLRIPNYTVTFGEQTVIGRVQADFTGESTELLMDAASDIGSLHANASLSTGNGTWRINFHPFEVKYRNLVTVALTGEVSPEQLALEGALTDFDVNGLPVVGFSNFTGRVSGGLVVAGSLAKPDIRAELDVTDFTSVEEVLDELPELNLHVSCALSGGRLLGSTVLTNAVRGSLAAGFNMPCELSFDPFLFKPDADAMHAEIRADVDLGILNKLAVFSDQRLAGRLEMDLVYDQVSSGFIRLRNGSYEHYKWGVVLREMGFELEAEEAGMRVKSASATDGGTGHITMGGGVASNELALSIDLSNAAIVRRDDAEATLSGNLNIEGLLFRPSVSGLLRINRADILVDNIAPVLPPLLVNYDAWAGTNKVDQVVERPPIPFGLDIEVDLADQVYAKSSMIDSIWGGNLHIKEVSEGISVKGVIKPQRGYVSFIGKKFRLVDGQIDLDGSVPSVPFMNRLTAEYSRGDFTAQLILNGRFDNPTLRMESIPAMPEDEILSHVLFGQEASSISTYQAYQLAAAAQQLSGGARGPGFIYQMRQAVGVDTLEWREAAGEGEASSVAAGKYLTPALYVEVNRSLDEKGDTGMMAEYDITRHFSIETSTGAKMRPGIGLNWKNDY
jgi:autotransporter translocation and assembly factor TamB